jgi:hypothetical protein
VPNARTGGEVARVFLAHWTLTSASGVFTAKARADEVVIGASDAMASDTGQTLCSVRWLCDVSNLFEPYAPNAVASIDPPSDASDERKSSLDAYWSASDAWRRALSAGRRTRPVLAETTIEL